MYYLFSASSLIQQPAATSSTIQQPAATSSTIQQPAATSSWFNALISVTNSAVTSQTNQSSMQVLKESTYFNPDAFTQLTSQYSKISRSTLYSFDLPLSTLGQSTSALSLLKSSKVSLSAAVGVSANSTIVKSIESSKLQQTSINSPLQEAMTLTPSFAISSTKMIPISTFQSKNLQSPSGSVSAYNSHSLLTSSSLFSKALGRTTLKSSSTPTLTAATTSSILRVLNSTRSVDSRRISFYSDSMQDRTSYISKSTKSTHFYSDTVKERTSFRSKSTESTHFYSDTVKGGTSYRSKSTESTQFYSDTVKERTSYRSKSTESTHFYSDTVKERTSYRSKSTESIKFYSDTVKERTSYRSKSTESNPEAMHESTYNISKSSIYSHTSSELKFWDTHVQRSTRISNTKVTHSDSVLETSGMSMTKFEQTKSSTYPSTIIPSPSSLSHTTEQTEPVMQHTVSYISASTWETPKLTVTTLQQMGGISSYQAQYTRSLSYSARLLPTATLREKQATTRKQLSDKEIGLSVGLPVAFVFLLGLTVWVYFMKSSVFTSRVCPKSQTEKADNLETVVALKYIPKDD